jgi:hypothetical protein
MTKKERKQYGLLPPKIAESDIVALVHGLCGCGGTHPFTIRTPAKTHSLLALTMIDPAINTGWFEIEVTNKSATSIQDLFHNTWLARYPRLQFIVFDNGGEFKRQFKQMCMVDNYGIKAKPTTSHNIPSIHKQMQSLSEYTKLLIVNDMLRSFDLERKIIMKI